MKEIKLKQNRPNEIKAVIWYIASRIFNFISNASWICAMISLCIDLDTSPLYIVFIGFTINAVIFIVCNTIAHNMSLYVYRKGYLSKKKVVKSILKTL